MLFCNQSSDERTTAISAAIQVKLTADNYYAVYSGGPNNAVTMHFSGSWSAGVGQGSFNPAGNYLYVVAWDDGGVFNGFLGSVAAGSGFVTTGSPLWSVCATKHPLPLDGSGTPSASILTPYINACTQNNAWHATSVGPNNGNASATQVNGTSLWGPVPQIDLTAAWIWDTNSSPNCSGTYGFLAGKCDPGEFLIFRIAVEDVVSCAAPVPSFGIDWSAGYGQLVANGSNSQNELDYFWSIQESNASWGRIGQEVTGWFHGQAGTFDLKSFYENATGMHLKCNTYYRVKLAVANKCISWRDTSQLIKLNCCNGDVTKQAPDTTK